MKVLLPFYTYKLKFNRHTILRQFNAFQIKAQLRKNANESVESRKIIEFFGERNK